jgi:hypothetical protein
MEDLDMCSRRNFWDKHAPGQLRVKIIKMSGGLFDRNWSVYCGAHTAVMKNMVSHLGCDAVLLAEIYRRFGGTWCFHILH